MRGFVHRITHNDVRGFLFQSIDKLVFDTLLNKETRAGATHLALVEKDSHHRAANRLLDIGISKHDVRRLTAKLKRNLCQVVGCSPGDQLADFSRTSKRNLINAGMCSERGAGCFTITGYDVDNAIRETGFLDQL